VSEAKSPPPLPQQPYFLRALYEWCVDNGYTPYLNVRVDARSRVPQGFVKDGQIVLNVGPSAVRNLHMDNDWVTFSARFGGVPHSIEFPVGNVIAIYARETGEGMAFQNPGSEMAMAAPSEPGQESDIAPPSTEETAPPEPPRGKPRLRVVK
jgi:stringent starvation protein B